MHQNTFQQPAYNEKVTKTTLCINDQSDILAPVPYIYKLTVADFVRFLTIYVIVNRYFDHV